MNKIINIGKEVLIQYIISNIDFNNGKVKDSYIWVEHCNIKLPIKSFIKRHQYEIISNQDYVINHCSTFGDYSTLCKSIIKTLSKEIEGNLKYYFEYEGIEYEIKYL